MDKRETNDRLEEDLRKQIRETEKKLATEKSERQRIDDQLEEMKRSNQLALERQDSTRQTETDLRKKLQDAQKQSRELKEEKEKLEEELQAAQAAQRASKKSQNKPPARPKMSCGRNWTKPGL